MSIRTEYPSEYSAWVNMRSRCRYSGNPEYHNYGGRGIKVCDRWLESFSNFLEDMGPKPKRHLSLDRVDNDGPYSPENCRWADDFTQHRNTRKALSGKVHRKDIPKSPVASATIYRRLAKGWSVEDAFKTGPIKERVTMRKRVKCVETGIIYPSLSEAARKTQGDAACIGGVCNGRYKTSGGFHWVFV